MLFQPLNHSRVKGTAVTRQNGRRAGRRHPSGADIVLDSNRSVLQERMVPFPGFFLTTPLDGAMDEGIGGVCAMILSVRAYEKGRPDSIECYIPAGCDGKHRMRCSSRCAVA